MHFISDHPIIVGVLCVLFISLPQWAQSVWGLFSAEPIIPLIYAKVKIMKIPNFSITWVTNAIGLLMLLYICVIVTSGHSKMDLTSPKTVTISEVDTNWEAVFLKSNPLD